MEFSTDQQIKAGLFVVIGLIVISASIVFLGDDRMVFSKSYELRVQLSQVQGLTQGSLVNLSGYRVGSIKKLDFLKDSQDLVAVLEIDEKYQRRITEGTTASIKTLGALGDRYIYLTPGPLDGKPLAVNSLIPSESGGDFFDMMSKKSDQISSAVDVVTELDTLLKSLNHEERVGRLIDSFNNTAIQLKALTVESRSTMAHFSSVMNKLDRGDGTLGALINDPTLHQKLTSFLGESPKRQFLKPLIRESTK